MPYWPQHGMQSCMLGYYSLRMTEVHKLTGHQPGQGAMATLHRCSSLRTSVPWARHRIKALEPTVCPRPGPCAGARPQ
jgi:hypothetical protein